MEDRQQRLRRQPVVPGQAAAVVHPVAAGRHPETGQLRADRMHRAGERGRSMLRHGHLPGQHLRGFVVAELERVLHDLGQRGAPHAGDGFTAVGLLRRLRGDGGAEHLDVVPLQSLGEGLRGSRRGDASAGAAARFVAALVDPQRGDRADHVLGDVRRLPLRVDRRAGEQRGVVAEGDPLASERLQRLRGRPRQGVDVRAGRVVARGPPAEQRVAAADEHDALGLWRRHHPSW